MAKPVFKLPDSERYYIHATQVFDGARLLSNKLVAVKNQRVESIVSFDAAPANALVVARSGVLSPGFFDIQVNGGGNKLFNTTPTVEGLKTISSAHRQFGTTMLLPTVITDTPDVIDAACKAVMACVDQHGIAGIHIEGPHISTSRKGTHKAEYIRPLDDTTINSVAPLCANDIPVVITLAPESVSKGQIARLVKMGVVVSIGHTDASAARIESCLQEGATLFTHLFNAMSQMKGREPGAVGAAINSSAYCSIICDGKHVADDMLALAMRARPSSNKMIIISDAMATVAGRDSFSLYGETITLKNGELVNAEGSLAGAHTTMAQSVEYLLKNLSLDLEQCLQMSITHPAKLLGITHKMNLLGMPVEHCVLIPDKPSETQLLH